MKTAVIIQARMNSTRLPGKAVMELAGKPVLQHVIERCRRSNVDEVIVATCEPADEIHMIATASGAKVYVGDENNVYKRVLDCAEYWDVDWMCEITSDCPTVDPKHITMLFDHCNGQYISNCFPRYLADGFDAQVYPVSMLEKVDIINHNHVGWNIKQTLENLNCRVRNINHLYKSDRYYHPYLSTTLDYKEDYEVLKKIFEHFGHNKFTAEEVMEFLFRHPEITAINTHLHRKAPEEN